MAEPRRPKGRKGGKASGKSDSRGKSRRRKKSSKRKAVPVEKLQPQSLPTHQLMKVLGHPLRLQILAILTDWTASPKEMSEELEEPVGNVSYHAKVLLNDGLILEDHQVPRRGAVEHFYRAAAPTVIPPGTWEGFPAVVQNGVSARIVKEFFQDACASMEAGIFDKPPGELSLTPLVLDQVGLDEIGELFRKFIDAVLGVQTKANRRLPKEKSKRVAQAKSASIFLASLLSTRSPDDDKKASSMKRR
jgi:DNA-binding transcriptional ArsR family regulator